MFKGIVVSTMFLFVLLLSSNIVTQATPINNSIVRPSFILQKVIQRCMLNIVQINIKINYKY